MFCRNDKCLAQGGEKSTGGNFITERSVGSNFTSGMQFYFYGFFCCFYFIKKLLHRCFGYHDLPTCFSCRIIPTL